MRRTFLFGLLAGLLSVWLAQLSKRGVPGAARLSRRIGPRTQTLRDTGYGYREIDLS